MINLFATAKGNANVMRALLKSLRVNVTSPTIYSCLHEHPDYPSLLSFTDCLKEWKIPNNGYRIDKQYYNPDDLSFPLLAHIHGKPAKFIVVYDIKKGQVTYSDERGKRELMTELDFLEKWDGIIVHSEPTSESGEKDYTHQEIKTKLDIFRLPILILFSGLLFGYLFLHHNFSWQYSASIFTTLAGTLVSIFLLMYSINANNPLLQNLCSLGNNNDCNAILKSSSAQLTNWLSWSEVGFFYFAGSLLSILITDNSLPILAILNICSLPYTIWSILYQYRAKNWCLLCCSVQLILWLQFVIYIAGIGFTAPNLNLEIIVVLFLCFTTPIVLWSFLKPIFLKAEQIGPLKKQINKFKYNVKLFNHLLSNQTRFQVPEDIKPIVLGDTNAPNTITIISNPFCGPCGSAHKVLDDLLHTRDDIKVKILFIANSDDSNLVSRHMAGLGLLEDEIFVEAALRDWYNTLPVSYETWSKNYPVEVNDGLDALIKKQKEWFEITEVTFTPTILINGYKLPDPYRIDDLKYFLS